MYDYVNIANETTKTATKIAGTLVWTIIAIILAIAAGIAVYFMFVKSDKPVSENLQKIRDLLDFKTMLIEPILKIVYIILTIFIVLFSFGLISTSFILFLIVLIFGPLTLRITYELMMINIMIWKNTKEINGSLNTKNTKKETKNQKEEK